MAGVYKVDVGAWHGVLLAVVAAVLVARWLRRRLLTAVASAPAAVGFWLASAIMPSFSFERQA